VRTLPLLWVVAAIAAPCSAWADARAAWDTASPSVQEQFSPDAGGLIHKASGFRCPTRIEKAVDTDADAVLTSVLEGGVAGAPGAQAAHCVYQSDGRSVVYLSISQAVEPIENAWCKALPKALRLNTGPAIVALSGQVKYGPPHPSEAMKVAGLPTYACEWSRPPVELPIIIAMVAAAQKDGWTAMAVHTPLAPKGMNGYRGIALSPSFFLTSFRLLDQAISSR
jgi:hypothetical protein